MSGALAPAGSSTYDSNTMHVGDGTWDTQRNTFLLPNLVGLNFKTMQYNGMGNRFKDLKQYHTLIRGHGVVAAITFLGIVPAAILIARFYGRNPYWALRLHIWLQVLTLLLSTVVFVLGFMAVGPERSLTNPHHGIGLAIYVLVLWQVINGWWVHKREKNKRRRHFPLKIMVHQWFGRMIAILGIVQIPLGLTLYGSPVYLFVLYTLTAFALLFMYFVLTYLHKRREGEYYDTGGSYVSRSEVVDERRSHSGLGKLAAVGAAGVGLAALSNRLRRRSRSRSRVDVVGSHDSTGSYIEEKYSEDSHHGGFGRKILEIGAIGGAVALAKRWWDRRRDRDEESDLGPYRPPLGGNTTVTQESGSRIYGQGLPPPGAPGMASPLHRPSSSSLSYSSYTSESGRGGHGLRNAIVGVGAFAALRHIFKSRRERKEQRRIEEVRRQDIDQERIARDNSRRYTGDGIPGRHGRHGSLTSTELTESVDGRHGGINPAIPLAAGAVGAAALPRHSRDHVHTSSPLGQPPITNVPLIPAGHVESSGSEMYTDTDGRRHHRHHPIRDAAAAGLAAGVVGAEASNRRRRSSGRHDEYGESPPVSVKVKMHEDGRHVTLRRLTEEEAARQRRERRRSGSRRRRAGSISSSDQGDSRWRRTEAIERQQAEEMRRQNEISAAQRAEGAVGGPSTLQNFPPPPPIPMQAGSVGSPGEITGTETSADYANNRRRRRAERAQAKQAREQRGQSVEFT